MGKTNTSSLDMQPLISERENGCNVCLEHSDSKNKYTEDDIINMLEFLVDNIFVVFGGKVFQQIVGIPMGTIVPLS